MPAVSVLTTAYNCAAYLPAAVESVLGQTFEDFELIIINDGSADETAARARAVADRRVRVIDNPHNLGRTPSLNVAVSHARGRYLACLDADDLAAPERLERQVSFLEKHPDCAIVGSAGRLVGANGESLGLYRVPTQSIDIHWRMLFGNPMIHSSVLMRRRVAIDEMGGYDTSYIYAQDYDLCSRISSTGAVANLAEPLVSYRVHDASLSATLPALVDEEPRRIRRRNLRRLVQGLSDEDVETLRVMGWGAKRLPGGVSVAKGVADYHRVADAFLAALPRGVAGCDEKWRWRHAQDCRSLLALVDACVQCGKRRAALSALRLARRRHSEIPRGVVLRNLAKIIGGRHVTNFAYRYRMRRREAYGPIVS